MSERPNKNTQFQESSGVNPPHPVTVSKRGQALLRALFVCASGFCTKTEGQLRLPQSFIGKTLFLYCASGAGWCEEGGRFYALRQGDLLVLTPKALYTVRAHVSNPWMIYWATADGSLLPDYLKEMGAGKENCVLHAGQDPQIARLFVEIHRSLKTGSSFVHLLHAANAFALLLAILIEKREERAPESSDSAQKIAEVVLYMSEHLNESIRVSALARLVSLSPTYFGGLFKEQTGCSPRDYLQLLRMHRACQLLGNAVLSVKEVATQVGYKDQFHFSRQFKAFQGVSPSAYRSRR